MEKTLGFQGYEGLREPFRYALVSSTALLERPEWVDGLRVEGVLGEVQASAPVNAMALVQSSHVRQKLDKMERGARMLLAARNVYISAVRASYSMAYYFHYVGCMALP